MQEHKVNMFEPLPLALGAVIIVIGLGPRLEGRAMSGHSLTAAPRRVPWRAPSIHGRGGTKLVAC